MNAPTHDIRVHLGAQPQHRQGGNDTFDQVISRNRDTYQWALRNQYTMERRCLMQMVLHTLSNVEGLEFYELNPFNGQWQRASEKRIRQAVAEALEEGLVNRVRKLDPSHNSCPRLNV